MKKILIFLFLISFNLIAQDAEKFFFRGVVINQDDLKPLKGIAVYNTTRLTGTLSNFIGEFGINVQQGDSIILSSIGYESKLIIIDNKFKTEKIIVKLMLKVYELSDVEIRGYKIRMPQRIKEFSLRRTDNITINMYQKPLNLGGYSIPTRGIGINISAIYDYYSSRQQQMRRIAAFEAEDAKHSAAVNRYSETLVKSVTNLSGNNLKKMMNYCRPTDHFVLTATEYELRKYVSDCFVNFKIDQE